MNHTDTARLNWLERHCYTVASGDYRAINVHVPVTKPSASLRKAIDRAMDDEQDEVTDDNQG